MHRHVASLVLVCALSQGCLSGGGVRPEPFPRPSSRSEPANIANIANTGSVREDLVDTATSLAGVPYREGGQTLTGFDCSGFTQYVFHQHGVTLPRLTREQYQIGHAIAAQDLRPGDLVFFTTVAPGASHVGVAVNQNEFVHAPSERGVVRIERLSGRYWASRFVGARRVIE